MNVSCCTEFYTSAGIYALPPTLGNYEDLDWASSSYLDPLRIRNVNDKDWFPKIDLNEGYIGDRFPLCTDLPQHHFLKQGAKFRLLGGSSL